MIINGNINESTKDILFEILQNINKDKWSSELFIHMIKKSDDLSNETKEIFIRKFKWEIPKLNTISGWDKYIPHLNCWEFDIWSIDDHLILFDLLVYIFEQYNLLELYGISKQQFKEFIYDVYRSYTDLPYHNFKHAFDVLHSSYLFLKECELDRILTSLDIFALLLAALIHDVGHNGVSNMYHVESGSPLALLYNDKSVLENHHSSYGFQIILRNRILENLSADQYRHFRNLAICSILYTDLSKHSKFLEKLKALNTREVSNEEIRKILVIAILKCSDISNPIKPFNISKKWGEAIQTESYCLGDHLNNLGYIEVPKEINRSFGIGSIAESQIKFIDCIMEPLFKAMGTCFPKFSKFDENIKENRNKWQQMLIEEKGGENNNIV